MSSTVHTLILSDIHLGSRTSRAREAVEMLKENTFSRLILLGDIFDDLNFHRLKKEHWDFLSYIRELSDPAHNVEVVWIAGNHDRMLLDIGHLLGVTVLNDYAWEYGGKKYYAVHGDQFDKFLVRSTPLSRMSTRLYAGIQRLDRKQKVARAIKRTSKKFLRLSKRVARGAMEHGKKQRADVVLCGHTHAALKIERDGLTYFNTGSWTDSPATYITIGPEEAAIHSVR